jgi:hypothetical protein
MNDTIEMITNVAMIIFFITPRHLKYYECNADISKRSSCELPWLVELFP